MDYINHGVILEPRRPKDWVYGGLVGSDLPDINQSGQWGAYLPDFEAQNRGFETMACVSYSALNCLEILARFHNSYPDFSDRFLANMSGTTEKGNSLSAVAETIRKTGLVMETDWPWPPLPTTWEQYYADIPSEVRAKASLIAGYSWRWVNPNVEDMKAALKKAPLQVCNEYHAFVVCGYDDSGWLTFDTYGNGKGHLPFDYVFAAAMLHSFDYSPIAKTMSADIKDNSLVVLVDTGERLMKIGEKLYSDDAGKLVTEIVARNSKDGITTSIPVWHGTSEAFDGVPRCGLDGVDRYMVEKGQRIETSVWTSGYAAIEQPVAPWWQSTTGSGVSLRLKGVMIMAVPLAVSIASNFGMEIKSDYVTGAIESLFALIGFGTYVWGQVQAAKNK